MKKRIAAVAATALVALQLTATGTAFAAAATHLGTQAVSLSGAAGDQCVFAGGIAIIQSANEAVFWTDGTYLYCDVAASGGGKGNSGKGQGKGNGHGAGGGVNGSTWTNSSLSAGPNDAPLLAEIRSIQVLAGGGVRVLGYSADVDGDANTYASGIVKSASFGGKVATVDTDEYFEWDVEEYDGYFGANVKVTNTTFSGSGLSGKFLYASALFFTGGAGADTFDASGVTALVPVAGNGADGGDTLKGGASDDAFVGEEGSDKLYGGAGADELDCAGDTGANGTDNSSKYSDQCWGGAGDDTIYVGGEYTPVATALAAADTAAPGDGYDYITGNGDAFVKAGVTYVDSSAAIDTSMFGAGEIDTTADFDIIDAGVTVSSVTGSEKADSIWMYDPITRTDFGFTTAFGGGGADTINGSSVDDMIFGGAGADTINARGGDDLVNGGAGDDVIYGGKGNDLLKGLGGSDQTWGNRGTDRCSGEVKDSCEYVLA